MNRRGASRETEHSGDEALCKRSTSIKHFFHYRSFMCTEFQNIDMPSLRPDSCVSYPEHILTGMQSQAQYTYLCAALLQGGLADLKRVVETKMGCFMKTLKRRDILTTDQRDSEYKKFR